MPRVSDPVSDSVWRVPKPTSVRIVFSMRCGEISATNAATSGCSGTRGAAGAAVCAIAGTVEAKKMAVAKAVI